MSIFAFVDEKAIGEVRGVDTAQVFVRVTSAEKLIHARVGRLVAIQGGDANEWIIGMINRVWRDPVEATAGDSELETLAEQNAVQVTLVGTYRARQGDLNNYFTRAVLSLPDINRLVFPLEEKMLEQFMSLISSAGKKDLKMPLEIGTYTLDRKAKAYLDADKLFQRHAALFGSTGSGKSYAVASILEQASKLDHSNVILFDLHGEYNELPYARQLRIAGPSDLEKDDENVLFLPFWLMNYEEMQSILIDYSEQSAPNQAMAIFEVVKQAKLEFLQKNKKTDLIKTFTIDSPIPFALDKILVALKEKNEEVEDTGETYATGAKRGQPKTSKGPLNDKLTRMLIRLNNKVSDLRYGFLFKPRDSWQSYESLYNMTLTLLGHRGIKDYKYPGIKVIDFSEVPSDVLPVVVSLVARLVFQVQFWTESKGKIDVRHPVLIICDEAHLYLPNTLNDANPLERRALENFERVAKEGRKYAVGLFVVSQRPADVSATILSQCNNLISLRLTNERDKSVVKNLLPDSLQGLLEILPGLEVGEAVVVGDAILLPTRIVLNKPKHEPKSTTVDFWKKWEKSSGKTDLKQAVENFRKQSRK